MTKDRVVRLWAEDPAAFLTGGVNVLPLAPLTNVEDEALPGVVQRMAARINAEDKARAAKLWTATYLLLGLRYSVDVVSKLLEGVHNMQESATYQAIKREGREEGRITEARRLVIRQAAKRLGEPDAATLAALEEIRDIDRLEALHDLALDANINDWTQLLRAV
jgi:predicted transposase YdaD